MASEGLVTIDDLPPGVRAGAEDSVIRVPPGSSLADAERIIIRETLAAQAGNKSRTADILGIARKTLYQKIQDYGLEPAN
jgi:DNA-binding NtrC family response regulator